MTQALTAGKPVRYSDGWLCYPIEGGPFFINATPGATSFHVLERGAGLRGSAHEYGKRGSLSAALKYAATLTPSTTDDIIDRTVAVSSSLTDLERLERLRETARPGTRLWVLPTYTEHGFCGLGEPATAVGLAVIGIESLFGSPATSWTVRYRTDSGREDTTGGWVLLTLAQARERWWVTDGLLGNLLTGGHLDRRHMQELAAEFPNDYAIVRQGAEFMPEA
jgi:hypothetical protein